MKTWMSIPENHDFSIHNLPYGVFEWQGKDHLGVAIGDFAIDITALAEWGHLDLANAPQSVFAKGTWNDFISCGNIAWRSLREKLQDWLTDDKSVLAVEKDQFLRPLQALRMKMPVQVGDYTDFYSSREHATNVGKMFRDPDNALLPNWLHIPVGYHGRASSIVVSGTPIRRPWGQVMPPGAEKPNFRPSSRLDIELEMAFVVGSTTRLGDKIPLQEAEEHIFGMVLFNDWSARDIQKWEYVPLGPFLGKNFGSSISPWIVPMEALEPFRTEGPSQSDPEPLPYLKQEGKHAFDIQLEVDLAPEGKAYSTICKSNFKHMYWSMAQQLTHHTVNGCNVKVGDLMASGTISGADKSSFGSLLELSWGGKEPITLEDGSTRTFLEDGDTVRLRGFAEKNGVRIGFGECVANILPAKE
jgi:fumarylacetoacetase